MFARAGRRGSGSTSRSAFPAPCRRARRSRSAASWWCHRAAESLPYVVLETAAAGKPLIATNVGGIPEIYGPLSGHLVPPQDAPALAEAIGRGLDQPAAAAAARGSLRDAGEASFSVEAMADGVLYAYRRRPRSACRNRTPLRLFHIPISLS